MVRLRSYKLVVEGHNKILLSIYAFCMGLFMNRRLIFEIRKNVNSSTRFNICIQMLLVIFCCRFELGTPHFENRSSFPSFTQYQIKYLKYNVSAEYLHLSKIYEIFTVLVPDSSIACNSMLRWPLAHYLEYQNTRNPNETGATSRRSDCLFFI